jgi:hypothetical protein
MLHRVKFLVSTGLILASSLLFAQIEAPINETLDALERKLEVNRHEGLVSIKSSAGSSLAEFTTDGCSGGLSAGWEFLGSRIDRLGEIHGDQPPWQACCISHDQLYHTAEPLDATREASFEARRDADLTLKACVIETAEERTPELVEEYDLSPEQVSLLYETVANLMYRAVRLGGMPCSGLPWRWGYGWPECN